MRPLHRYASALLLTVTLTIPLESPAGSRLDRAIVEGVPPATFQVLETRQCGGVLCWRRYAVVDGRVIETGTVCEPGGDRTPNALEPRQ